MTALAHRVILAWGWTRALIAFIGGAVGAFAMPPFGFVPALAVSLTLAVWLLDGSVGDGRRPRLSALRAAAVAGWFWGFGYFVAGLWWLGAAFLVEADQFAWALPFGVLGLPAVLALFPAAGFAIARLLWSGGAMRLFALAAGLSLAEYARGTFFTGFPWNTLGMAFGQNLWLMQAASVVGLYGLTVLAIVVLAAPATIGTGATPSQRYVPPTLAAAAIALLAAFGATRIPQDAVASVPGVRLRIMQPNLPQDEKFRPERRDEILRRYLQVSDRPTSPQATGVADATHLIWPESVFPFLLDRDARALAEIGAFLPDRTVLVTGAARADEPLPGERPRFYNAIQVVTGDGVVTGSYDKRHLVPFGEYFPWFLDWSLRALGLRQFVHVPGGFDFGRENPPLVVPGLPPVAASICYEAIFPGAVVPAGLDIRPGVILNVTNDAWFGMTPGPYQHYAQARLRAVEEGLPLLRAANNGISAVVDPYGREVARLGLGLDGALDSHLPVAMAPPPAARYRIGSFAGLVALCGLLSMVARLRPSSRG